MEVVSLTVFRQPPLREKRLFWSWVKALFWLLYKLTGSKNVWKWNNKEAHREPSTWLFVITEQRNSSNTDTYTSCKVSCSKDLFDHRSPESNRACVRSTRLPGLHLTSSQKSASENWKIVPSTTGGRAAVCSGQKTPTCKIRLGVVQKALSWMAVVAQCKPNVVK